MSDLKSKDYVRGLEETLIFTSDRIQELEQQLSNSISKDDLRGLVKALKGRRFTSCQIGRGEESRNQTVIWELNKLIEGDSNG